MNVSRPGPERGYVTKVFAGILVATAIAKWLDASSAHRYWEEPDPLLPFLSVRELLLLAGAFEVAVGVYVWFAVSLVARARALLWFCAIVLTYKVCLFFTYDVTPCNCFGVIGKALRLNQSQLDTTTWLLLSTIVAYGLAVLAHHGRWQKRGRAREYPGPQ